MPPREYPAAPLVGVGAVILDDHGRVALIRRGSEPRKGLWSIPGGLVELGESLLYAVRREAEEETGLHVSPQAIVEVVDRIYLEKSDIPVTAPGTSEVTHPQEHTRVRYHYVLIDYWCRVESGTLLAASDAAEATWAGRDEWLQTNPFALEQITRDVIEKAWQMFHAAHLPG